MIPAALGRARRSSGRGRREEVRRLLSTHGLAPHRRRASKRLEAEDQVPSRLRAALESLGPVFKLFGLYLSTRVDLLPAAYCAELATLPDRGEAESVEHLLPAGIFAKFDPAPIDCRSLWQRHRAWLDDGTAVTAKITHHTVQDRINDIELLQVLETVWEDRPLVPGLLESAVADFSRSLRERMDFTAESNALDGMARDSTDCDIVYAPRVRGLFANGRVLVVEAVPSIDEAPEQSARLISMAWLRQALLGQTFPVDVQPANVRIISEDRVAFESDEWARLTSESQGNLWDYLVATANEDPDRACTALLKEMANRSQCPHDEDLRRALRQLVPFRHTDAGGGASIQSLAKRLFLHWRFATKLGYIPAAHLPSFFRGLLSVAEMTNQLIPERDMLVEAIRDVRVFDGMTRMRSMFSLRELGDWGDKYAAAFLDLPKRVDKFLTIGADGSVNLKISLADDNSARRRKNSSAFAGALLIACAALLLVVDHVMTISSRGFLPRLSPVIFASLGALVIWAIARAR